MVTAVADEYAVTAATSKKWLHLLLHPRNGYSCYIQEMVTAAADDNVTCSAATSNKWLQLLLMSMLSGISSRHFHDCILHLISNYGS